jgi:hypothetical protein
LVGVLSMGFGGGGGDSDGDDGEEIDISSGSSSAGSQGQLSAAERQAGRKTVVVQLQREALSAVIMIAARMADAVRFGEERRGEERRGMK